MNVNHEKDWGSSVRMILQGLILAGILGVVGMLWKQNEATAAQNVALNGRRNETVSLRAAKAQRAGRRWGCVLCRVLGAVAPGHCEEQLR